MIEKYTGYIEDETFKGIIENMPMVSIDLIVKNEGKVLLGKRLNKPAEGYWFTLGGRVLKNESIDDAIVRIGKIELDMKIESSPKFIGIFEHLYDDSIFEEVSTHYINIVYEMEVSDLEDLPKDQHDDYRWFEIEELMQCKEVHPYIKDCFTEKKGTTPQERER